MDTFSTAVWQNRWIYVIVWKGPFHKICENYFQVTNSTMYRATLLDGMSMVKVTSNILFCERSWEIRELILLSMSSRRFQMFRCRQEAKNTTVRQVPGLYVLILKRFLGPVYTKLQRQCCNKSSMTLALLFSLKTMELLQNWGYNPFSGDSIVFNENYVASVIAELMQCRS